MNEGRDQARMNQPRGWKIIKKHFALFLAGFYMLLGGAWIIFSDSLLAALVPDPEAYVRWQIVKGWFYVAVTGVLLYLLVRLYLNRQRRDQRVLRDSEERLRTLFEQAGDAIFIHDFQGNILEVNREAVRRLGYPREELLTMQPHHIDPTLDSPLTDVHYQKLIQPDEAIFETLQRTRGGTDVPTELSSRLIDYQGKPAVLSIARDITQRHHARQALEESEERYRLLAETTQDMICIHDMQGRITYLNPAALEFIGADPEDALQKTIREFIPEEEIPRVRERKQERESGQLKRRRYVTRFLDQQGNQVPVEVSSSTIVKEGGVEEILLIARDISQRVKAEEKLRLYSRHLQEMVEQRTQALYQAREELFQKEKMAVLGQLAGGVGHELRNPLGVMSNAVYYMKLFQDSADPKIQEYLGILEEEIDHAENIITDLLGFSRTRQPESERVDVRTVIKKTLGEVEVPEQVDVVEKIPDVLPAAWFDPGHLKQVLWNIFRNAVQAMPDGGELTIAVSMVEEMVRVEVRDTGTGIKPEDEEAIFKPLFTTKARGIGLGLPISRRLMLANEGKIDFESVEGEYTVFTLHLPVAEEMV